MKPYYQDPWVTIYHGDCRDVLPSLDDKSCEIAVTSPPYNLVREWSGGGPNSNRKAHDKKQSAWYPDSLDEKKYQEQQRWVVQEMLRVCRSSIFYNHKVRYAYKRRGCMYHPLDFLRPFEIWQEIIWNRQGSAGGGVNRFLEADERIYMIRRPRVWHTVPGASNVWTMRPEVTKDHVCAFPIQLPMRCILATTCHFMTVLDPYCGSGTTLRAAKDTRRRAVGIEIEEKYCEVAARRMRQEALALT